ncbi:hypothetical protein FBUS_08106 [Fasciolopsis buskii]|uniref:Uncharacterized protein n=1 Tax=Fasciolopsis buskii TaxID=27845 RepID=A0A8E0VGA7_9TREM|nr:hypothetical protein FBUS_08106 [Fasciolopsis buski]
MISATQFPRQICHEIGATLGSSHAKIGDLDRSSARPVEQSDQSAHSSYSLSAASGSTALDQLGPLERIRHHPALIRFRLPSPVAASQSPTQPSGHPVTFEFAAFAFSLGLNGGKPCSALDPIPYERRFNGANDELDCQTDTEHCHETTPPTWSAVLISPAPLGSTTLTCFRVS